MLCILAGCYSAPQPDCGFFCSSAGECPADYHCAADGICHLDGTPADTNCGRDAGVDARIPDTTGDVSPPQVSLFNPGDGVTGVPVSTLIQAGFTEPVLNTAQGMSVRYGAGAGEAVAGTITYDPGTHVATFTPDAPLVGNNLHVVSLSSIIIDNAGNSLVPLTWTFVTANDGVGPVVSMTTPANTATAVPVSSTISVVFSEPVTFGGAADFTVSVGAAPVTGTFSASGIRTIVFTPDDVLPGGSLVEVSLSSGIKDYSNIPLNTTAFSFTTQ